MNLPRLLLIYTNKQINRIIDQDIEFLKNMNNKTTMEERFRDKFLSEETFSSVSQFKEEMRGRLPQEFMNFIRQELALQAKEIAEEIEKELRIKNIPMDRIFEYHAQNDCLNDCLSILKKYE